MNALVDLAPLVVLAVAGWFFARAWRAGRATSRWTVRTIAVPGGGYAVELVRPGQPPQRCALIDAGLPAAEFSDRLAEAQAEAEDKAAALNAVP